MILIKNAMVYDGMNPGKDNADILISDGRILKVGHNLSCNADRVIDAKGLIVMPGFVDAHCHLREPGYEYKEDIASGTRSAAMGGFTQVACMPNTLPVIDNAPLVYFIRRKAETEGVVKVHVIGAITKGLEGESLSEMGELRDAGVVALSDDGKPVENARMMKLAMEYAKAFGLLIISHCEDTSLSAGGAMNEGYYSTILGLRGISRAAEEIMAARDILLAETLQAPIHIAHASTRGTVELVRQAKKRGVKVTCETAPHYFSADDSWVEGYDTNTKVNPPLRTADDVEAIKEGLKDGTIDIIATDHAPHHIDEKDLEYDAAANGISGFETAFSLAYTNLVMGGILTMEELVAKMSVKPASILGLKGGIIKEGAVADLAIADLNQSYIVDAEKFVSKGKNTPFNGSSLTGRILYTLVDGNIVIDNGKVIR
jgi:dihydroorotase